jgi:hypothetical protein
MSQPPTFFSITWKSIFLPTSPHLTYVVHVIPFYFQQKHKKVGFINGMLEVF